MSKRNSTPILYRIRNYSETFLTDKTRERDGRLRFLQLPVRPDDVDYISIATGTDGALVLGVWLAILELAGTLPVRDGALRRSNGNPLTIGEISALTRLPLDDVAQGVAVLARHDWLVSDTPIPNDSERCATTTPLEEGRGGGFRGEERRLDVSKASPSQAAGAASGGEDRNVNDVVAHYVRQHPRAKPGAKARKSVRARLAEGYSANDLMEAIDGCHRSPHHCGENDRGTKYQTLGLIMRDSDHVQQFIDVPLNGQSAHEAESIYTIQDRLNRERDA